MQEAGNDGGSRAGPGKWRGYAQIALVAIVLVVALYLARAPGFQELPGDAVLTADSVPPVVDVVVPSLTEQSLTVHLTGTVSLQERTTVVSEVEGRIAWVSPQFNNGGFIAAGETLIRIEPTEFALAVDAAQAAVEAAEARVWLEEAMGAEYERAFVRANPGANASPWIRRQPQIALTQAELKQAQVALKLAELQLSRTQIAFPYDVRIMTTDAAVGEWASPEDTARSGQLGIVYQPSALQVEAPIDPGDLAYLEPATGRAAQVTGQRGAWMGEIVRVSSVIDPRSRLSKVFIDFAATEPTDSLPPPGTFVEIAIEGPAFSNVFVLPNTVVRELDSVWVVEDGNLHLIQPEAYGQSDNGWVVKAFDAGEGVVVGTLPGAREGLAVTLAGAQQAK